MKKFLIFLFLIYFNINITFIYALGVNNISTQVKTQEATTIQGQKQEAEFEKKLITIKKQVKLNINLKLNLPEIQKRFITEIQEKTDLTFESIEDTIKVKMESEDLTHKIKEEADIQVSLLSLEELKQIRLSKEITTEILDEFTNELKKSIRSLKKDKLVLDLFGYDFFDLAPSTFAPSLDTPVPFDYSLGPGDEIKIILKSKIGGETIYETSVDQEGQIYLSGLGMFYVNGLTKKEVEKLITERVKRFFKTFEVRITISKVRGISVFVVGEARRPGSYNISSLSTVFNAIYVAGGPNKRGSMRNIKLIRNNKTIVTIDLYEYLLSGKKSNDLPIQSGDTLFVPVIGPTVTVIGEVNRPAIYEIKGKDNLNNVLSLAGSLKASSYLQRIQVERFKANKEKNLLDVKYDEPGIFKKVSIYSGDKIRVYSILEELKNQVEIKGPVNRPGVYAFHEGMKISDLINEAEGFKSEVYKEKGDIFREKPDKTREVIPFNLELALQLDHKNNISIRSKDIVVIYSPSDIMYEKRSASIIGLVQKPGEYYRYENMKIKDLIQASGGVLPNAAQFIELSRRENGEFIVKEVNLDNTMKDGSDNLTLQNEDRVYIKESTNRFIAPKTVQVIGKVNYPGEYPLKDEKETLFNLLQRAGGAAKEAFPKGAVFIRRIENLTEMAQLSIAKEIKSYIQTITQMQSKLEFAKQGIELKTLAQINIEKEITALPREIKEIISSGRVPVNIEKIIATGGKEGDVVLRDGDIIRVPEKPVSVIIAGAVLSPSALLFKEGEGINYYVSRTGGYALDAEAKNVVVVKANGETLSSKLVKNIEAGDIIVVPNKALQLKKTGWERFVDILRIVSDTLLLRAIWKK